MTARTSLIAKPNAGRSAAISATAAHRGDLSTYCEISNASDAAEPALVGPDWGGYPVFASDARGAVDEIVARTRMVR